MSLRIRAALAAGCCILFASTVFAQSEPPFTSESEVHTEVPADGTAPQTLDVVVVTGRQPGPGLWKVSRGGHVLWVMATWSPLPKHMEWNSGVVERRISESQELLLEPGTSLILKTGLIDRLTMIPAAAKMRGNPDGKKLSEVVSPQQYARWLVLKKRHIGRDEGIEKLRPYFASNELALKASDRVGVSFGSPIEKKVVELARRHRLKITDPRITVVTRDVKNQFKEASRERVDDQACFEQRLTMVEHDLGLFVQGANAWAQGDVELLRELGSKTTSTSACNDVIFGSELMQRHFGKDGRQDALNKWVQAVEVALAQNSSTFAILSFGQVINFLPLLAEKGYAIEAP